MRKLTLGIACMLSLGLAACGGSAPESDTAQEPPVAEAQTASVPSVVDNTEADAVTASTVDGDSLDRPYTSDDIDAYLRGMHREAEMLQATLDKVEAARAAKDENAQTMAMMEAVNGDVERAGATAAGLDFARYGKVKDAIDSVLVNKAMGASGDANVKAMFDAQLQENLKPFDNDARAALEARAQELEQAHSDVLGLRFKIAQ